MVISYQWIFLLELFDILCISQKNLLLSFQLCDIGRYTVIRKYVLIFFSTKSKNMYTINKMLVQYLDIIVNCEIHRIYIYLAPSMYSFFIIYENLIVFCLIYILLDALLNIVKLLLKRGHTIEILQISDISVQILATAEFAR